MTPPAPPEPFKLWINARGQEEFLHGTRAALKPGDLIEVGRSSNYGAREAAAFVYLTATLDAATWGRSWLSATGRGTSTSWGPRGPSRTTRTSRT